jgi:hypothetical protein
MEMESIPGNNARNACWHFLAQSQVWKWNPSLAKAPEMLVGVS